jgi:RES domain-containing protein
VTVNAWRIVKSKHAAGAFSGAGARKAGGRWNSPGWPVVYTAGSQSLAILEMLVHLQAQELLRRYVLFPVTFDEALITTVDPSTLPKSWRNSPPPASVQRIGNDWLTCADTAILRVPSVLVPSEWNYLLNPAHADFPKIIIGVRTPVRFDPRLIKAQAT